MISTENATKYSVTIVIHLVYESKIQHFVYCSCMTTVVYDNCDYHVYVLNSLKTYDVTWPSDVNIQTY